MGLHDKHHPKYQGPYKFIEITKNQNYIVEDHFNERLKDTFSLQCLKVDKAPFNPGEEYWKKLGKDHPKDSAKQGKETSIQLDIISNNSYNNMVSSYQPRRLF
ncbi:hypothetical protein BpHYR1_029567 [Brachionus plicatilis]|uniref:Uncharacterized protein n=1 Tax=Brachionus plicatilis TaxID=10195 RepID=A0A3M7P8Z4_BRAPC|nr:hypothetical protein BpHYR1_029567 [Brachionus plicatilis]